MKKYIKNYMKHFGYCEQDVIMCEMPGCNKQAVDIHHIIYKSQGGGDEVDNLIGLCRDHHEECHDSKIDKQYLLQLTNDRG